MSDELICLAFFDDKVDHETKYAMVQNLKDNVRRSRNLAGDIDNRLQEVLSLSIFVSQRSMNL